MTVRIEVELHPEVVTALRALADKHGITMTEALKRAIATERFLDSLNEDAKPESVPGICDVCGKPMPEGEEMFKFHGYSGPCPSEPPSGDAS